MSADFHILLIDDSPTDVLLVRRALDTMADACRLTTLTDGAQAWSYLEQLWALERPDALVPDLILLDWNLPGPDGRQLLNRIKTTRTLRGIPTLVLSTSERAEDVWTSYQLGANTYVQKPADFEGYRHLLTTLYGYWHRTASRPPQSRPKTEGEITEEA